MQDVKIVIEQKRDGVTRTFANILPETAIPHTQRLYGQEIKEIIPVDEYGNEIKIKLATNPKERARKAMEGMAVTLGITNISKLTDEELLKKIQDKNSGIQPTTLVKQRGRTKVSAN